MSKLDRIEIPVDISPNKYMLTKVEGRFQPKHAKRVEWIEWDENGCYKTGHPEPAIGRSLMLDPHPVFFTWQTTNVTEIVEQTDSHILFRTKNSFYKLEEIVEE